MAKQARAQITRESILRAAGVVFSTSTYSAATLADVIKEAGVTQGALYFHFDSKQELAVEVVKRQHEISLSAGTRLLERGTPGIESMVMLSSELARQIMTDPIVRGGLRLSTESPELFPEFASRPYLDWIAACEKFLHRAIGEGHVSSTVDTSALARFIISSFTGVQVVSQALTEWEDILDRLEEMWEFVLLAAVLPERKLEVKDLPRLVRTPLAG